MARNYLEELFEKAKRAAQNTASSVKRGLQNFNEVTPEERNAGRNRLTNMGFKPTGVPATQGIKITDVVRQTSQNVAKDFGNMFRNSNVGGKRLQPVRNLTANTAETVGSGVSGATMNLMNFFQKPTVGNAVRQGAGLVYNVAKPIAAGTPFFQAANIATQTPQGGKLGFVPRTAKGIIQGVSGVKDLSPEVQEKKQNFFGMKFDPAVAGGEMLGFVKNPANAKLFKATEGIKLPFFAKAIAGNPGLQRTAAKVANFLSTNAVRGSIEDIMMSLDELPEDASVQEQAKYLAEKGLWGAVSENIGRGFFKGTEAGIGTAGKVLRGQADKIDFKPIMNFLEDINLLRKETGTRKSAVTKTATTPRGARSAEDIIRDIKGRFSTTPGVPERKPIVDWMENPNRPGQLLRTEDGVVPPKPDTVPSNAKFVQDPQIPSRYVRQEPARSRLQQPTQSAYGFAGGVEMETDENGNPTGKVSYNPEKGMAGFFAAGAINSKGGRKILKHFTSPDSAKALREGAKFDFSKTPIHGTGGKDFADKVGRFIDDGKPALYLSLDDNTWKTSLTPNKNAKVVEVDAMNLEQLKQFHKEGGTTTFNYETQKLEGRKNAFNKSELESVSYEIAPNARTLVIDSPQKLSQVQKEVGVRPDDPNFWTQLRGKYDIVELRNVKKSARVGDENKVAQRFFSGAKADQAIVLNPEVAKVGGVGSSELPKVTVEPESVIRSKTDFIQPKVEEIRRSEAVVPAEVKQPQPQSSPDELIQTAREQISKLPEEPRVTWREAWDRTYTDWVNRFHPIEKVVGAVEKNLKEQGAELLPQNNPKYQIRRFLGMGGIAESKFQDKVKPILNQMEENGIDKLDMDAYLKARRDINLGERGIYGSDPVQAAKIVEAFEAKYGADKIQPIAQQLYDYQNTLFDELTEAGFIKPDVAARIKATNADYVPFERVMDDKQLDEFLGIPTKKVVQGTNPADKRIKGSTRDIYSPIESIIANTYKYTAAVEKNKVARSVAKLQEIMPEIGFTPAKEAGADTIPVWVDGVKQHITVGKDIADAAKGLNEESMNNVLKIMQLPAQILRSGATGQNPEFMIPNVIRDQLEASLYSNYGYVPFVDYFRGMAHLINKSRTGSDEIVDAWMKSGASQELSSMSGRKDIQSFFNKNTGKKGLFGWLGDGLEFLGKYSEQPTRLGLFEKAYNKTGNTNIAMMESRDATLDFSRMGSKMKVANSVIPFLNVGIQGFDKLIRESKNKPGKTALKVAIYGLAPQMMSTMYNLVNHPQEYAEIPQFEKDGNFIFVQGRNEDGTVDYYTVPKANSMQTFVNPVESFLSYMAGTNQQSFGEFATGFLSGALPVVGEGQSPTEVGVRTVGSLIPQIIKPAAENLLNKSFFRYNANKQEAKEIVPYYLKDKAPGDQAYDFTPAAYKVIGKVLNVSPLQVQNLAEGYFAGYAKVPVQVMNLLIKASNGEDISPNEVTLMRRFSKQTYPTSQSQQKKRQAAETPLIGQVSANEGTMVGKLNVNTREQGGLPFPDYAKSAPGQVLRADLNFDGVGQADIVFHLKTPDGKVIDVPQTKESYTGGKNHYGLELQIPPGTRPGTGEVWATVNGKEVVGTRKSHEITNTTPIDRYSDEVRRTQFSDPTLTREVISKSNSSPSGVDSRNWFQKLFNIESSETDSEPEELKLPSDDKGLEVMYKDAQSILSGYEEKKIKYQYGRNTDPEGKLEELEADKAYAEQLMSQIESKYPEKIADFEMKSYASGAGANVDERAEWAYNTIQKLGESSDTDKVTAFIDKLWDEKVLTGGKSGVAQKILEEYGINVFNYGKDAKASKDPNAKGSSKSKAQKELEKENNKNLKSFFAAAAKQPELNFNIKTPKSQVNWAGTFKAQYPVSAEDTEFSTKAPKVAGAPDIMQSFFRQPQVTGVSPEAAKAVAAVRGGGRSDDRLRLRYAGGRSR